MTILANPEFKTAMGTLMTQHPDLLSTAGLSLLLADIRRSGFKSSKPKTFDVTDDIIDMLCGIQPSPMNREIGKRIMADPTGWCLEAPDDVKEGAAFYQRMGTILDPSSLEDVFRYHTIRDHVGELQKALGLSSQKGEEVVTLFGRSIEIGEFDDQLIASDQDKLRMRSDARKVCDFFISQVSGRTEFELVEVMDDESEEPTTIGSVFGAAHNLESAWIFSQSHDWVKLSSGGWQSAQCDRDPATDPDEVTLYFDVAGAPSRVFKATHTSPDRHPWLKVGR